MTSRRPIDLNADLGEGIGSDAAMLGLVTSANVACGLHAGDPHLMHDTFVAAAARGVSSGAHPGYADREGFGRRVIPQTEAELERLVAYQVGAACGIAALAGVALGHVKAHGALYTLAAAEAGVARAVARAIRAVDRSLVCLAQAETVALVEADRTGLATASEVFADRAYLPSGMLVPRDRPGAVLHDAALIADRLLAMLSTGTIRAIDGSARPARIDSVCIHGDTPGAVAIATTLAAALDAAGWRRAAFAKR